MELAHNSFGFDESMFPFIYNSHNIFLVENEARFVGRNDRISFDFCLYCNSCEKVETIRGRASSESFDRSTLQLSKLYVFRPFLEPCV
jgi:hypothetical protein